MAEKLAVGVAGKYFQIDGKSYQCGQYDYEFTSDARLLIWNVVGSNKNSPVCKGLVSEIIDGATDTPFANEAAIKTWLNANFFFIGGGEGSGGGSVAWTDITSKPTDFTPSSHNHIGDDITSGIVPPERLGNTTPDNTKVLYGDSVWRVPASGGGLSGLSTHYVPKATSASTIGDSRFYSAPTYSCVGTTVQYSNGAPELTISGNCAVVDSGTGKALLFSYYAGTNVFISQTYGANFLINPDGNRIGVGHYTPHASAIVDIESTTQGVGIPRMSDAQIRAIASPRQGLVVYNTTIYKLCVYENNLWMQLQSVAM